MEEKIKYKKASDYKYLIGKDFITAKELLYKENRSVRCIVKDGNSCIITQDLNPNRLNVSITNGLIDKIFDFS